MKYNMPLIYSRKPVYRNLMYTKQMTFLVNGGSSIINLNGKREREIFSITFDVNERLSIVIFHGKREIEILSSICLSVFSR